MYRYKPVYELTYWLKPDSQVVAYDSGTKRARQMLTILESILPYFLRDLVRDKSDTKNVRDTIQHLTVAMKALINNCDELTK